MIKAVLLDIDNTILDFDACVVEAMRTGFRKYELPPYRDYMFDVFTMFNDEIWRQFERKEITLDELLHTRWQRILNALNMDFDGYEFEKFFVDYIFHSHIPVAGAYDLLQYLKEHHYLLGAVSNGPFKQQQHRLEQADMLKYFPYLFISEQMGVVKPEKAFFDLVLAKLNENRTEALKTEEIMIIGDSLSSDIQGGVNAGWVTCYLERNPERSLLDCPADYCVRALADIKNIL